MKLFDKTKGGVEMKTIFIILLSFIIFITIAYADVVILKPVGIGDYTVINYQFPDAGEHWDKVDDIPHDGDGTKVHTDSPNQQKDAYNVENISLTGTINFVSVYFTFESGTPGHNVWAQPYLRLDSVETSGTEVVEDGYAPYWDSTYSEVLGRPGGGTWVWPDINNLQVCIGLRSRGPGYGHSLCTNVYVEVDYSATNIEEPNDELPVTNQKLTVFPNPFTTATSITLNLPSIGHSAEGEKTSAQCQVPSDRKDIALHIYDVSGRLIKNLSLGTGRLELGTEFKPGVYFLKVKGCKPVKVVKLR